MDTAVERAPGDRVGRWIQRFYDARASEEPASDPEASVRFVKALRAATLRPGERVLDVGSKWGGLGQRARHEQLDIEYVGLDISAENVERAARLGLDVRRIDANRPLPIADAEFDCVTCLELLEHLPEPLLLLAECRRVLKPAGRLVFSVPNPYSWVEVVRELTGRPDPEGHLNAFTTPVIENLLGLSGFALDRRLGTSVRLPKTMRLLATDSILARSRLYVARPTADPVVAGRPLPSG